MPVRRRAERVDIPPWSHLEWGDLMGDPETPLDPDKWERWTVIRAARRCSYRDAVVQTLGRGMACQALGLDPDPEVARQTAAILAEVADGRADWYLRGAVGWGTGIPSDPAELAEWRAEKAAPHRYAASFWRARLSELEDAPELAGPVPPP